MTRNEVQVITNYKLNTGDSQRPPSSIATALKRMVPLLADDKRTVVLAFVAMLVTSASSLLGPVIIGRTVDLYIQNRNFAGVLTSAGLLLLVYLGGLLASYFQTLAMG